MEKPILPLWTKGSFGLSSMIISISSILLSCLSSVGASKALPIPKDRMSKKTVKIFIIRPSLSGTDWWSLYQLTAWRRCASSVFWPSPGATLNRCSSFAITLLASLLLSVTDKVRVHFNLFVGMGTNFLSKSPFTKPWNKRFTVFLRQLWIFEWDKI